MKCKIGLTVVSVFFLLSTIAQPKKTHPSKRAVICLTYDDGLSTQLDHAIPQLDSLGFKATFFLPSIQGSSQSEIIGQTPEAVLGWTNAAKNGHELANHTLFHPCPANLGWDKSVAIDNYTTDKIVAEVITQNMLLSVLDPSRKERAFAYPCNNNLIGGTNYSIILKENELITFARTGGDSNSVITNFKQLDILNVPSWHVWTGTTLQQLISFAEKVRDAGGMGIYQIHGIDGQIFSITKETHSAFLNYLKQHESDYLVTTFSEAMKYVKMSTLALPSNE